jgi:amino acid transporter
MALFACVTICGVGESAYVAIVIFIFHVSIMTLVIIWGFGFGIHNEFSVFLDNIRTPYPDVISSEGSVLSAHNFVGSLFFGYCSALLGITGFETAANYVEQMESSKVFVSTAKWLWVLVGFYNPLLSFVAMMVLPMDSLYEHPSDLLAVMAHKMGGSTFRSVVCVDAVVVLCGAVLTSIIGVSALIVRLSGDNILPSFLGQKNSRQAPYIAIVVFVALSMSLFLSIYAPDSPNAINDFGGVYAIAFLCVLSAFAVSAILLKLNRAHLARRVIARWWEIIFSLVCVLAGLFGNIILTTGVFTLFLAYLSGFAAVVMYMFCRVDILTFGIWMVGAPLGIVPSYINFFVA